MSSAARYQGGAQPPCRTSTTEFSEVTESRRHRDGHFFTELGNIPRLAACGYPARMPRNAAGNGFCRRGCWHGGCPFEDCQKAIVMITLRQILAATDFTEASRAVVDRADALASAFVAQLPSAPCR